MVSFVALEPLTEGGGGFARRLRLVECRLDVMTFDKGLSVGSWHPEGSSASAGEKEAPQRSRKSTVDARQSGLVGFQKSPQMRVSQR
jgi:hypothetical protein